MKTTASPWSVRRLFEIFFPPSEDELMFRKADYRRFSDTLLIAEHHFTYLLPYHLPEVRAAIHLAKFHHHLEARTMLGALLAKVIEVHYANHLIVPIPLSRKRERERGYNQVTEILKMSKHSYKALNLQTNILLRTKHTVPQSSLDKAARKSNIIDAFTVKRGRELKGKHIVIIDDVATTGSTLKAARAELNLHSPASITCLAIAH